jgi:hypothetical protein
LTIINAVQFFPLILWYFMFGVKILIFWVNLFLAISFQPNHFKKIVCMFMRNYKDKPLSEGALKMSFFDLLNLKIWDFWQSPLGCDEVKKSMGLLQGPKMIALTTKSPIWENHWVPLGCRAMLGSVKDCYISNSLFQMKKNYNVWTKIWIFRTVCLVGYFGYSSTLQW